MEVKRDGRIRFCTEFLAGGFPSGAGNHATRHWKGKKMLQERTRQRWIKHWKRDLFCGGVGLLCILFFWIGCLFYPYLHLPRVTAADLDVLQLEGVHKVMIVAHPDDELLWGGKHLLEDDYLVVCLTRGKDKIRRAEFEAVLAETGDQGLILSYPDKIGSKRSNWKLWRKQMEADLKVILQYQDWELVATHNAKGEYGHPQHIMTHQSVKKVYQEIGCKAELNWFGRYYVDDKVPYDLEEMDKEIYNQKRKIAKLYQSQRASIRKLYHMLPYEYWTREE